MFLKARRYSYASFTIEAQVRGDELRGDVDIAALRVLDGELVLLVRREQRVAPHLAHVRLQRVVAREPFRLLDVGRVVVVVDELTRCLEDVVVAFDAFGGPVRCVLVRLSRRVVVGARLVLAFARAALGSSSHVYLQDHLALMCSAASPATPPDALEVFCSAGVADILADPFIFMAVAQCFSGPAARTGRVRVRNRYPPGPGVARAIRWVDRGAHEDRRRLAGWYFRGWLDRTEDSGLHRMGVWTGRVHGSLVIDDEPLLGRTLSFMLEENHDVVVVDGGAEALRRLGEDACSISCCATSTCPV